jgi:hypothetical protein
MNPALYVFDLEQMERDGTLVARYKIPYADHVQLSKAELERRIAAKIPLEFGHTLADQIGGQTAAGFVVAGFYEDVSGWNDPVDQYLPVYIATLAKKPACGGGVVG